MRLNYNVTGAKRKELVQLLSSFTGCEAKYLGAPTFAYKVGEYRIDRNGVISSDKKINDEVEQDIIFMLRNNGFQPEFESDSECDLELEYEGQSIGFPIEEFPSETINDEVIKRLAAIIQSKHTLFKKAIGTTCDLNVELEDGKLWFDWFDREITQQEADLYEPFMKALVQMAITAKRVTAKEKPIENEKFAMRTFLNRLGLSGPEYKPLRKALIKNLSGNSAFRYGEKEAMKSMSNGGK